MAVQIGNTIMLITAIGLLAFTTELTVVGFFRRIHLLFKVAKKRFCENSFVVGAISGSSCISKYPSVYSLKSSSGTNSFP